MCFSLIGSSFLGNPTIFIFLFQRNGPNLQLDSPLSYSSSPSPLCSRFSLPSFFPLSFHSLRPFFTSKATSQAASDSSQPSQSKTVRVAIKGRVQGVFYRNWTIENATQLRLKGWVRNRNRNDGSVEALFSGNPDSVQEMEQWCRRGPPAAMVTGLEVFPSSDDPGTGFERKQTV
ncbi:acylphosphatase-like [Hibiscus syriacus]|uniref:acylphosphatase-like n=1 Tax=Hibiscus syriacus TaxID=106335 RepID=UPI00192216A2|nr:acylphosphatase-like [Hibiscus syriacus]